MTELKASKFLTTTDNPFNPFEQFLDWYTFDCNKKYFTCNYVNRVVQSLLTNNSVENESDDSIVYEAMKQIVSINPELYRIVEGMEISETLDVDYSYDY